MRHFFLNGGSDAYVVRIVNTQSTGATVELTTPSGPLVLMSALEGARGNRLRAQVEIPSVDSPEPKLTLTIQETDDPYSASPIVLNESRYEAPTPNVEELQDALAADTSMVSVVGTIPAVPNVPTDWIPFSGGEAPAANARVALPVSGGAELILEAEESGDTGNDLRATIIHSETNPNRFALIIEREQSDGTFAIEETFPNLSIDSDDSRFVVDIIANESAQVEVQGSAPATRPAALTRVAFSGGSDTEAATVSLQVDAMSLQARNPGAWGNHLQAIVDFNTANPSDTSIFNLTIEELDGRQ